MKWWTILLQKLAGVSLTAQNRQARRARLRKGGITQPPYPKR